MITRTGRQEDSSSVSDETLRRSPEKVGIPVRLFLFTLDQISTMLAVDEDRLKRGYLFYEGRSVGVRPPDKILARNIAPAGEKPEWRVAEKELVRWARSRGFRIYDRGWSTS